MHLLSKALLAHLSVSQWSARKLDKQAGNIVAKHGVGSKGNFNKTLLPTCNELGVLHKYTTEVRKNFYLNVLPWFMDGTFILTPSNYLPYLTEFRAERSRWLGLKSDFLLSYPQAQRDAERILNSGEHPLYNERDYPHIDQLEQKFSMEIKFLPMPDEGDFRTELADSEMDAMRANLRDELTNASQAAVQDVWQRLYDKVSWLHGRLADPKNTFHDATYKDAQDMCELLTRLNFTNDPNLEAMRMEMQQKLVNHHPESLRNDPILRQDTADEAKAIMDKMSIFMGGLA